MSRFDRLAAAVSRALGKPAATALAVVVVLVWAVTGPVFHFSDTWQLVANTGTTVVTFLMVFVLQNTQMRDTDAIHLKLDELLRAVGSARTELARAEEMSEAELRERTAEIKRAAEAEGDRRGS